MDCPDPDNPRHRSTSMHTPARPMEQIVLSSLPEAFNFYSFLSKTEESQSLAWCTVVGGEIQCFQKLYVRTSPARVCTGVSRERGRKVGREGASNYFAITTGAGSDRLVFRDAAVIGVLMEC